MESENRPYVDPGTEPGDARTEDWPDKQPGSGGPGARKPQGNPAKTTDDNGIIDESPADEFINDPDAITARNDEGKRKV